MANDIPAAWLPSANVKRIITHWTGGGHSASNLDKAHYHILVEGGGTLVRGLHTIDDNDVTSDGVYAAHTKGMNTGSIGVSACAMAGASESPFNAGSSPMTERQWETLIDVVAQLCRRYGIPVKEHTVLAHGEVEETLGAPQNGKWDPLKLPWNPQLSKSAVGDLFREKVRDALQT